MYKEEAEHEKEDKKKEDKKKEDKEKEDKKEDKKKEDTKKEAVPSSMGRFAEVLSQHFTVYCVLFVCAHWRRRRTRRRFPQAI